MRQVVRDFAVEVDMSRLSAAKTIDFDKILG
jgi:hypothetical protein